MAVLSGLFRLGRDSELRYTPGGDAVTGLSLAYNYGRKGADGKTPSQWIEASLWGKLAEALNPYLLKGGQVYAEIHDIHIEEFQGKNGAGVKLAGRISQIQLAGGRTEGQQAPASKPAPSKGPSFNDLDDDLMF